MYDTVSASSLKKASIGLDISRLAKGLCGKAGNN